MEVIDARNAHQALPKATLLLQRRGVARGSRNGDVLVMRDPVTTRYAKPLERVVFWPERDANPFLHLYESLWMLAGRDDVAPLARYAKRMLSFSDDGVTLRGAYGRRWRDWFQATTQAGDTSSLRSVPAKVDQLAVIARRLCADETDRRCVLQMWEAESDLDVDTKDAPCNVIATLQRGVFGELNLVVFCRSNDIVWGAYGANAVHFGFLLEYLAAKIGCSVGTYHQVSVNWHGYKETLAQVSSLARYASGGIHTYPQLVPDPYVREEVVSVPMPEAKALDGEIVGLLWLADNGMSLDAWLESWAEPSRWFMDIARVLHAHYQYRANPAPLKFERALHELSLANQTTDWVVAAREWVERRAARWSEKQQQEVTA